ncbi:MAG: cellulase family glycosylhydrolase [Flavobacteriaceae bacterium]
MSNFGNKNLYRVLLLVSFLGLNGLILYGIASTWAYLNTGADRSSMLHLQKDMKEAYLPKVIWEPLGNEGRSMEKQTLDEIQKDYLAAWYVRNLAFETNDAYGISDYYTENAREKIKAMIDYNKDLGTTIKATTLEHHPELEFYSADGHLVVFSDGNVVRYEEVYSKGTMVISRRDTTRFRVMMLLEDGFWHIRHLVPVPSKVIATAQQPRLPKSVKETIKNIKGLNYYPQDSPWDMFGDQFNEKTIGNDFALIRQMGMNTVRIFVPYEAFGKAKVDIGHLERLRKTLDLALENRLEVIVTLFDFYGDYDISDWTLTHRHAEQIVKALKDHKALMAWDLKNEPDLDFEIRGKANVLAWLGEMANNITQWDNQHWITIGWSSPEAAVALKDRVDFISFHYYRGLSEFPTSTAALKKEVPDKPLLLQEYGRSSYGGIWNAFRGSEESQATYFKEMQTMLKDGDIPFLFWTLYDFDEVPSTVVGQLPWRKQPQKYFGLIDTEGNPKAAFQYLNDQR